MTEPFKASPQDVGEGQHKACQLYRLKLLCYGMATELKFSDLDPALSSESLAAVASFGFTFMTPVQASSIPYFLKNKV